jgi:hypothetical protein
MTDYSITGRLLANDYHFSKVPFASTYASWIGRKGSPILRQLEKDVLWMRDMGLIEKES